MTEQGLASFTLKRYPCINKNFWVFSVFLILLGCQEKNVQDRRFSGVNTKINILVLPACYIHIPSYTK